jgi:hypothetical protein
MQQSRASRFHCSERPTKLNQQLLRPFNHRTLQQSHRKHSTMEGDYALPNMAEQHMRSQSFDAPQVTMETDGHFGDDGPGGMMQHEDSLFADASMADVGDMYGLGDTLSQAPYYGIPQVDPDLSQLFDDDMADVDLQADSNDVSPTQASLTPANRPKRSLSKRNKKGKQKQAKTKTRTKTTSSSPRTKATSSRRSQLLQRRGPRPSAHPRERRARALAHPDASLRPSLRTTSLSTACVGLPRTASWRLALLPAVMKSATRPTRLSSTCASGS